MKTINLFYLFSLLLLLSCKKPVETIIGTPAIVAGTAKITGRITGPNGADKDNIFVTIGIPLPISGEYVKHKVFADRSGKFSVDVNVETDITLIGLYTSLKPEPLNVTLDWLFDDYVLHLEHHMRHIVSYWMKRDGQLNERGGQQKTPGFRLSARRNRDNV